MFVISLVSFIKFLFYFLQLYYSKFFRFVKKIFQTCGKILRYSSNELGLRCFGCRENFVLSRKMTALNFCCAAKWSCARTSFSSTCNLPLKSRTLIFFFIIQLPIPIINIRVPFFDMWATPSIIIYHI